MAYRVAPAARVRRGLGALSISDLASAITRNEGTCPSPSSCRNNNPGNLRAGPGAIGTDSRGIAIFPDYQTGESALEIQITLNVNRGLDLSEFFQGKPGVYAGYDKTDPMYASKVAGWLGIPQDVPLGTLLSGSGDTSPAVLPSDSSTGLEIANAVDLSNPLILGAAALGAGLLAWMLVR